MNPLPAAPVSRRLRNRTSALLTAWFMFALIVASVAPQQFIELGKCALPENLADTRSTVFGDVDRDGDVDLVVGNFGQQTRLYLNDGSGVFRDATALQMPTGAFDTNALAFLDADGDGDLDLVLANEDQQARLYMNDGSGSFTDDSVARLPSRVSQTRALAVGDVDRDGDLDLFLGNDGDHNWLYLNDGSGRFLDASGTHLLGFHVSAWALVCADVDGDGDLDLVVGDFLTGCRLHRNDGTGTFSDSIPMPLTNGTTALAAGDVDLDGDLDLVFGTLNGQSRIYLNDGAGRYRDATATHLPTVAHPTRSVALADLDQDGDQDLVLGNERMPSRVYLNDGAGVFAEGTTSRLPGGSPAVSSMSFADVDGDGDVDLVQGCSRSFELESSRTRLYLNDGGANFTDATGSRMPIQRHDTRSLALGDVDGDGDLDLLRAGWERDQLYLNDGSGLFSDETITRMPRDYSTGTSLALGDLDMDGDLDVVVGRYQAAYPGAQSRLYENDGRGRFLDATATNLPLRFQETHALALGDVDGDRDLDLVLGNGGGLGAEQSSLYLNDGTGVFRDVTSSQLPVMPCLTNAVVLGDVDGDGDLDLLLGNVGQSRCFLNDGSGGFVDATMASFPAANHATVALALADLDGDGDPDLVFGNHGERSRLYLNDGGGRFLDATVGRLPADARGATAVEPVDVDEDGDLDLILAIWAGPVSLYRNDGTGSFTDTSATQLRAFPADGDIVVGDVDGDGDDDFIATTIGQAHLYTNLLVQLDAPLVLRVGADYRIDVHARHGQPSAVDVALPFLAATRAITPLPPLGVLGLDPTTILALPPLLIPRPLGTGSLVVRVPSDPALRGRAIHFQALLLRYPIDARLTGVITDVALR